MPLILPALFLVCAGVMLLGHALVADMSSFWEIYAAIASSIVAIVISIAGIRKARHRILFGVVLTVGTVVSLRAFIEILFAYIVTDHLP